jgi:hypothetical protein
MRDRIVIANCGGFWGDDPTAARRQVQGGPVDYLVMDYLAEVTMAILQKQRRRDPDAGFATDFLTQLRDVLVECVEREITIITNAGGANPVACGRAVEALAAELGVADRVRVGVVVGDDLAADLDAFVADGERFEHLDTGAPFQDIRERVLSANVYLGAPSLVTALAMDANVVVAGRVTDASVTLAPMMHEFGWAPDDWDQLAAGVVAGHVIECGTQCTGGNFTDWQTVPSFVDMGYPLVEASADGTFVVTKHPGTGGTVTVHTVSEQLLYEVAAPSYLTPDCIARFDSIRLEQVGPDRVRVTGVRGDPPPDRLKVSCTFSDGYRVVGRMMISGPDALAKATKAAEIFWGSAGGEGRYDAAMTQFIGWNACHPPLTPDEPGEILVQVAARDRDREKLETCFAPFVVGRGLGSVPGWAIPSDQGRPRVSEVVGHWPALVSRDRPTVRVLVGREEAVVDQTAPASSAPVRRFEPTVRAPGPLPSSGVDVRVPLGRICLARSGDKGDTANIGVIARSPAVYDWMVGALTADVVARQFRDVCRGGVDRFELPNLLALNFLLYEGLGGGGTSSLQFDNQGKTYAQYLLAMVVEIDEALLSTIPSTIAS